MGIYLIDTNGGLRRLIGKRILDDDIRKLLNISDRIDQFVKTINNLQNLGIPLDVAYKIEIALREEAYKNKFFFSELLSAFRSIFTEIRFIKEKFSEWETVKLLIELAKESVYKEKL